MYKAPRGITDILPGEQSYWRYLEQKAVDACHLYGYQRIDFPAFEDTGLFTRGVGEGTDIVEKEMYTFDDRGGNSLTLVPEGTAPVCRAYLEHGMYNLQQPVKLYYFSSIFRYERPQAGRYRQHHQFGCEAIGNDNPALDAEVIEMAWHFFRSLNLGRLSLQLNSIGCRKCRPGYLVALKEYYTAQIESLCADCRVRFTKNPLRLLDCKQPSCQPVADAAPRNAEHLCPECSEHFNRLKKYLDLLDIPFVLNHRLVRGFDYYTRTVFELQPELAGSQSALGGGGRYDDLIEMLGGKPTPAIGFATGMERIIMNLKNQAVPVPSLPGTEVYIAHLGDDAADTSIKLASRLRQEGISVIVAIGNKSLKAQLRQAGNIGARYALIIGDDEVKAGTAVLRDMVNAQQQTVPIARLPGLLK